MKLTLIVKRIATSPFLVIVGERILADRTISYLSYIIILKNSAVLIHADIIYYAIRALKKLLCVQC